MTYSNRGLYIGNTSTNKYHCRPRLGVGVVMVPAATLTAFTIDDDGDDGKSDVLSGGGRDARSLFCPHMRMPSFILSLCVLLVSWLDDDEDNIKDGMTTER